LALYAVGQHSLSGRQPINKTRQGQGPVDIVSPADGLSGPGCSSEIPKGLEPSQKKLGFEYRVDVAAQMDGSRNLDIHVMMLTPLSGPGKGLRGEPVTVRSPIWGNMAGRRIVLVTVPASAEVGGRVDAFADD